MGGADACVGSDGGGGCKGDVVVVVVVGGGGGITGWRGVQSTPFHLSVLDPLF